MSVVRLEADASSEMKILKSLEHLKRCSIAELGLSTNTTEIYIKASVHDKKAIQKLRSCSLMKLRLKDFTNPGESVNVNNSAEISVYLVGEYAENLQDASIGESMYLTKFSIEASVNNQDSHSCQIIAHIGYSKAKIWVWDSRPKSLSVKNSPTKGHPRKSRLPVYNYSQIDQLKPSTIVNVYGVVKFFKSASKTQGSDSYMTISIVDKSWVSSHKKLKCVLFMRDNDSLPKINRIGDLIRFHRLKIVTFNGELQGQVSPGFSWMVVSGALDDPIEPVTINKSFTLTENDKKIIKELREKFSNDDDLLNTQLQTNEAEASIGVQSPLSPNNTLNDLKPRSFFDFTCQVLAVYNFVSTRFVLLRVADGTKPHCVHYKTPVDSSGEECVYNESPDVRCELLAPYIVDICVYDNHYSRAAQITPGEFIKLVNLHAVVHRPQRHPHHHGNSDVNSSTSTTANLIPVNATSTNNDNSINRQPPPNSSTDNISLQTVDVQHQSFQIELTFHGGGEKHNRRIITLSDDDASAVTIRERLSVVVNQLDVNDSEISSSTDSVDKNKRDQNVSNNHQELIDLLSLQTEPERCQMQTITVLLAHQDRDRTLISDIIKDVTPNKYRLIAQLVDIQPKPTSLQSIVKLFCPVCHFLSKLPSAAVSSHSGHSTENFEVISQNLVAVDRCELNSEDLSRIPPAFNCPKCSERSLENVLEYYYMQRWLLRDMSGCLSTQIWGSNANQFFKGISASELVCSYEKYKSIFDFYQNTKTSAVSDTTMNQQDESIENPVSVSWVDCCVMSFKNTDGTFYQMFNTSIVLDDELNSSFIL